MAVWVPAILGAIVLYEHGMSMGRVLVSSRAFAPNTRVNFAKPNLPLDLMIHLYYMYHERGWSMATINLRDFPDDLHRTLKVEAAKRGTSVKALLIQAAREWLKKKK